MFDVAAKLVAECRHVESWNDVELLANLAPQLADEVERLTRELASVKNCPNCGGDGFTMHLDGPCICPVCDERERLQAENARLRSELWEALGARDRCWHCHDTLDVSRPRCERCPDECDVEGCEEPGCTLLDTETEVDEPNGGALCHRSAAHQSVTVVTDARENCCEHGDHAAPEGKRFCSTACERCEHESVSENGCDGICKRDTSRRTKEKEHELRKTTRRR